MAAPAPTIRLATAPLPAATPTMALPKATVALPKPTLPLGESIPLQPASFDSDEEEEGEDEPFINVVFAGIGLAAALIVLAFQLMTASAWVNGEWSKLSPF
jgi:hypothetical protein